MFALSSLKFHYHNSSHNSLINSHHQQDMFQYHIAPHWYWLFGCITLLGFIISLVSNIIIIYLFAKTTSLKRNPSNIIAVNLSLSDLLYCCQWPSVVYCSFTQTPWILEISSVCQTFGFITTLTASTSVLTVLAMSMERALVIIYSLQARSYFSVRVAWAIVVLIWVIALLSSLPPFFGRINRFTLDPSRTSCTFDYMSNNQDYKGYTLFIFALYWIIPSILIIVSYVAIFLTFRNSALTLRQVASEGEWSSSARNKQIVAEQDDNQCQESFELNDCNNNNNNNNNNNDPDDDDDDDDDDDYELDNYNVKVKQQKNKSLNKTTNTGSVPKRFFSHKKPNLHRQKTVESINSDTSSLFTFCGCQRKVCATCQNSTQNSTANDKCQISAIGFEPNNNINIKTKHKKLIRASQQQTTIASACRELRSPPRSPDALIYLQPSKSATSECKRRQATARAALQFRLARMSLYLILLWFVSWAPIALLVLFNSLLGIRLASDTYVVLANSMTKLGPAFDVFIYGLSHPRIKSRFKNIIRSMLLLKQNTNNKKHQNINLNNSMRVKKL